MKNLRGKMIFKKLLLHQFPKIYDFGRATTLLETLALCVTVSIFDTFKKATEILL